MQQASVVSEGIKICFFFTLWKLFRVWHPIFFPSQPSLFRSVLVLTRIWSVSWTEYYYFNISLVTLLLISKNWLGKKTGPAISDKIWHSLCEKMYKNCLTIRIVPTFKAFQSVKLSGTWPRKLGIQKLFSPFYQASCTGQRQRHMFAQLHPSPTWWLDCTHCLGLSH